MFIKLLLKPRHYANIGTTKFKDLVLLSRGSRYSGKGGRVRKQIIIHLATRGERCPKYMEKAQWISTGTSLRSKF